MESLDGKYTQEDYDALSAKLVELQLEQLTHGVDNSKEIQEIQKLLEEI